MFFHRRKWNGDRPGPQSRGVVAVAILCLALLALLTVAQAVHTHPNPTVADHCPLCITMHTVVPTAVTAVALVLVQMAQAPAVPGVRTVSRLMHPDLYTRPPPMGC